MLVASFLFAVLLAAASCVLTLSLDRPRRIALVVAAVVMVCVWPLAMVLHSAREQSPITDRPLATRENGYIGSSSCGTCHPAQHETWSGSYHRTMTQVVSADTVIPKFEGQVVEVAGVRYRLERQGDEFTGTIYDPAKRQPTRLKLVMSTGSHHMQLFWYHAGNGCRVEQFPIVYLIDEQQWIPRLSSFILPTECVPRLTQEPAPWNAICIDCHATNGRPRLTAEQAVFDTVVAEFGIACEACHGPGEQHMRANQNPLQRYQRHISDAPDPTIVNATRLPHQRSAETCGQCHSIRAPSDDVEKEEYWFQEGNTYRPGGVLAESRPLADLEQTRDSGDPDLERGYFWPDGMVRVTGREYNALVETPCFQRGEMSCLSCHQMHQDPKDVRSMREWANDQLKPGLEGDQACLQCHDNMADDLEQHTHHAADSSGSRCYNCHMPHTTYGLLTSIRSHQIDVPDASVTLQTGRPNACNLCHLDKTLAWTSQYLNQWYGHAKPTLDDDHRNIAASIIWMLKGDAGQRALLARGMSWEPAVEASGNDWAAPFLAELLDDSYDAVRFVAWRSLRQMPGFEEFSYDFLAPSSERVQARGLAIEQWSSTRPAGGNWASEVLINKDGSLTLDVIRRLISTRDNRPLNLLE